MGTPDGGKSWIARNAKILIADDDLTTRVAVINYLSEQQVRAVAAEDGQKLMGRLATEVVSLVILDLQIGQNDGLDLLREIQSRTSVPVIITGRYPCDAADPLVGLEIGADDYLAKPFGLRELLARIRAVLRRRPTPQGTARQCSECRGYRFGGWHLDQRSRRLTDPSGNHVPLTRSQYGLMLAFLRAPGRPLNRQALRRAMSVHDNFCDRAVDVQILRLRRKLVNEPGGAHFIGTERGLGYVFTELVEELAPDAARRVLPIASSKSSICSSSGTKQ